MTIEEQLNQKQEEIHNLQVRLKNKCDLLDKIKKWLNDEVEENLEVVEAWDNNEEFTSDGTDEIIVGRSECAEGLLNYINDNEKETD
jgi:predicted transcriptional regulator